MRRSNLFPLFWAVPLCCCPQLFVPLCRNAQRGFYWLSYKCLCCWCDRATNYANPRVFKPVQKLLNYSGGRANNWIGIIVRKILLCAYSTVSFFLLSSAVWACTVTVQKIVAKWIPLMNDSGVPIELDALFFCQFLSNYMYVIVTLV